MKKIFASLLIIATLLGALAPFVAAKKGSGTYSPPAFTMPDVSAECAVLVDADSRASLAEKNADKATRMSITMIVRVLPSGMIYSLK